MEVAVKPFPCPHMLKTHYRAIWNNIALFVIRVL
jgi:hypothetical protein